MNENMSLTVLDECAKIVDAATARRYADQKSQGVVNPIVLAKLVGVRPQMIYNYIAKGRLPIIEGHTSVGSNSTQKKVIDAAVAEKWAEGYLQRAVARAMKAQAELEGEPSDA